MRILACFLSIFVFASCAHAQTIEIEAMPDTDIVHKTYRFQSYTDSADYQKAKKIAAHATGYRIEVSLFDRRLYVISGVDTIYTARTAVATRQTLIYGSKSWTFILPRGVRKVLAKTEKPVWTPPEWHYAEIASKNNLTIKYLKANQPIMVEFNKVLAVRDSQVVVSIDGQDWQPMRTDEEIVFGDTLYVPPPGTHQAKVEGELGPYSLSLGDGYLIHGTPDKASIGAAATHGCLRLSDKDITWLYEHVAKGTKVYIY